MIPSGQNYPDGSREPKLRMTHDQSYEASAGSSINKQVHHNLLEPLYYGGCLSRIINKILSIRARHLSVKNLGRKSDFKVVYRRINVHGDIAAKCSIMYRGVGLPSLRLTFGGSPCPNELCIISELCTDLANDILHCPQWQPEGLFSPHQKLLSDPVVLDYAGYRE